MGSWGSRLRSATAALLACSACVGYLEEPERRGDPSLTEQPPTPPSPPLVPEQRRDACKGGAPELAPPRLWRLSDSQYTNAVEDLLPGVRATAVHTPGSSEYAFVNESELLPVSGSLAYQYQAAATAVARQVGSRLTDFLNCGPEPIEEECARSFIDRFASRAFRRPLGDLERTDLMALYRLGRAESFAVGIETVIEAVLQAPDFLYRTEFGGPASTGADRIELTPYELAAELSFLLLDSIPDESLWHSAENGSISDPAVLASEIERLLGLPRVRANLDRIFVAWLGVRRVLQAERDPAIFPDWNADLRQSVLRETELFIDDVLWTSGGGLKELLGSRRAFVDGRVAALYGVDGLNGDEFLPVLLPEQQRAGILTRASVLATLGRPRTTDIVHRGLFVRRLLLCLSDVPPPPPEVVGRVQAETAGMSERQSADYRANDSVCGGCHAGIDPLGIPFEIYDGTGRFRSEDDGQPVRAEADIAFASDASGHVADAVQLSERLAQSQRVSECVAGQMVSYALGRAVTRQDACTLQQVHDQWRVSGQKLVDLFRVIPMSDAFRFRKPGASQ